MVGTKAIDLPALRCAFTDARRPAIVDSTFMMCQLGQEARVLGWLP
jgi:hypothetical protein